MSSPTPNLHGEGTNLHGEGTNLHGEGTNLHGEAPTLHGEAPTVHTVAFFALLRFAVGGYAAAQRHRKKVDELRARADEASGIENVNQLIGRRNETINMLHQQIASKVMHLQRKDNQIAELEARIAKLVERDAEALKRVANTSFPPVGELVPATMNKQVERIKALEEENASLRKKCHELQTDIEAAKRNPLPAWFDAEKHPNVKGLVKHIDSLSAQVKRQEAELAALSAREKARRRSEIGRNWRVFNLLSDMTLLLRRAIAILKTIETDAEIAHWGIDCARHCADLAQLHSELKATLPQRNNPQAPTEGSNIQ